MERVKKVIFIGSDHAGWEMKQFIKGYLKELKVDVTDVGPEKAERCDYPDFAQKVCEEVQKGNGYGIVVCGSGTGISISANKFKGIRCSICNNLYVGLTAIDKDSPNVIAFGERIIGNEVARQVIDKFLNTPIDEDEKLKERMAKLKVIEDENLLH